jgi:hypothetical protein
MARPHGALSSPRHSLPPLTPKATSPRSAPRGCPLSQCRDPREPPHRGDGGPNIVKDGTPARGAVGGFAIRVHRLTPEALLHQWSAASRSRGLRREGHETWSDGARCAPDGRGSRAAAGARKRPRGRARANARARAAPQALPPNAPRPRLRRPREADRAEGCCAHLPPTLARDPTPQAGGRRPPTTLFDPLGHGHIPLPGSCSSLSVRVASEARRDRPGGHTSEAERAGRGERGGARRDSPKRGWREHRHHLIPAPAAGG